MASVVVNPAECEGLADMEDDDLFEINLEAVNCIPPPHYWDSYFTATGNVLLANCMLPISDISNAVPIQSKDVSNAVPMVSESSKALSLVGKANFVMTAQPMPLGKFLRLPFLGAGYLGLRGK
ncbi:POPTR_0004s14990g [Fagus crenata]